MQKDERDLLEVLKCELEFLERGLYIRLAKQPWRPQFFFEDSPSCLNYGAGESRHPCSECALASLVPPPLRAKKIPCRYIPLNSEGETLDSLYRSADDAETKEVFRNWLRGTIATLEETRRTAADTTETAEVNHENKHCEPLFQKLSPKCANPACPVPFHWRGGGKFFRFRPDSKFAELDQLEGRAGLGPHKVRHYWLCENCSHLFTLVYDESEGVILKWRLANVGQKETARHETAGQ